MSGDIDLTVVVHHIHNFSAIPARLNLPQVFGLFKNELVQNFGSKNEQ